MATTFEELARIIVTLETNSTTFPFTWLLTANARDMWQGRFDYQTVSEMMHIEAVLSDCFPGAQPIELPKACMAADLEI